MNNESFNINSLELTSPTSLTSSFYFTKLLHNNDELILSLMPGNFKKKVTSVKRSDNFIYFHINSNLNSNNELFLLLDRKSTRLNSSH